MRPTLLLYHTCDYIFCAFVALVAYDNIIQSKQPGNSRIHHTPSNHTIRKRGWWVGPIGSGHYAHHCKCNARGVVRCLKIIDLRGRYARRVLRLTVNYVAANPRLGSHRISLVRFSLHFPPTLSLPLGFGHSMSVWPPRGKTFFAAQRMRRFLVGDTRDKRTKC